MTECAGYKDAENHEYCTMGECEQNCKCNRKYEPYCCDEDQEYSNGCIAECNGFKLNECDYGKCDHICACPKNIDTICCDGQEYDNACLAECDGFKDAVTNSLCKSGIIFIMFLPAHLSKSTLDAILSDK